jgi:hypothetical protein
MSAETENILQLLELRIAAMSEIADSLSRAGAAIASCDIDSLEARIVDQETLCMRIRGLDVQLEAMQTRQSQRDQTIQLPSFGSPSENERKNLRDTMGRLKEVHERVKLLNGTHADLLRRSRRTVRALAHAYQAVSNGIYSDPTLNASLVGERV